MRAFLEAQEFQHNPGKSFGPPAGWLKVGHIDEYASFLTGGRVLFADSRLAIELLESQIPAADRAERVFFATSGNTYPGTTTAATAAVDDQATPSVDESRRIWTGINHLQLGSTYQYIRFYEGAAKGHVAKITLGDGWVQVADELSYSTLPLSLPAIWFTGASMSDYEIRGVGMLPNGQLSPTGGIAPTGWLVRPAANDKYVLVEGTKRWRAATDYDGMPAVITVEEVLGDPAFVAFNRSQCPTTLTACQAAIQAAAGQDTLSFIPLPALFFGSGTVSGANPNNTASAFNPGPSNLQPLGGALYMPRQFGPFNAQGKDFFEEALKSTVPETVYFVDDWEAYHRDLGEVHCGSCVKRSLPDYDWWTKLNLMNSSAIKRCIKISTLI